MTEQDFPKIKRIMLDRINASSAHYLDIHCDIERDAEMVEQIAMRMTAELIGKRTIHPKYIIAKESVPLTWWDGLKAEKFPKWWLSRWPARTRTIETSIQVSITNVCPHQPVGPVPRGGGDRVCIDFLVGSDR